MHLRLPRAAVDITPADDLPTFPIPQRAPVRASVLWASRGLEVRRGRLLGVRIRGDELHVALVGHDTDSLRWVAPEGLLSESQARVWVRTARFAAPPRR